MSDFFGGIGKAISSGVNFLSAGGLIDALGNGLGLPPVITNAVKTVTGAVTGNVLLTAAGVMGLAKELSQNQAAYTEFAPSKDDKVACEGYAKPGGKSSTHDASPATQGTKGSAAPGEVRPDGALDPSILEYRQALKTLDANFTLFDTVDNVKNGKFTRQTLEKVADSASMPASVRNAARFLLAHPEYRTQLDTASQKGGFVDGTFSTKDVRAALSDVETRIAKYGVRGESQAAPPPPPPPGTSVGTQPPAGGKKTDEPATSTPSPRSGPASSSVKDIINDPNMGLEEKIQAILMALTERMDGEILDTMDDLAAAQDKMAGISNEKGNEKALSDAKRDVDRITTRLQQLVEKRKMMFEMMSTMSMKFNEMAKTALSNMRSA
ncbi:hypothetical protein JRI60_11835 [Archangium violaceum]|uniref:hypothetical protein n=1 Tax=Archangium violaceum TaxID=83451 RepID=UPI001951DB5A|nr:hypothetical protein [Archangium violaceum]QRN99663.1 hypothetical protein JRI60_11835 [Archangium violaceum]